VPLIQVNAWANEDFFTLSWEKNVLKLIIISHLTQDRQFQFQFHENKFNISNESQPWEREGERNMKYDERVRGYEGHVTTSVCFIVFLFIFYNITLLTLSLSLSFKSILSNCVWISVFYLRQLKVNFTMKHFLSYFLFLLQNWKHIWGFYFPFYLFIHSWSIREWVSEWVSEWESFSLISATLNPFLFCVSVNWDFFFFLL
jgi:hypothetical protein